MEKRTAAPRKETIETVASTYKRTGSINETALQTEMSTTKVRKILITEGLWESDRSREIRTLSDEGKSSQEIAEALRISRAMVQNYLPYEKGLYDEEEKSETAIRSEQYRSRNRAYAQKSKAREGQNIEELHMPQEATPRDGKKSPYAMQLHLELRDSRLTSIDDGDEAKILAKYGKVETSISRDVIVPSCLALHQLHYLINMAFGWTNSHLHKFQLSDRLYETLTEGKLLDIIPVFGYYLKFPNRTFNDEYWDDDYDESKSPRTWMRSKYLKMCKYQGYSDYWIDNQTEILDLTSRFPILDVQPPWWDEEKNHRKVPLQEASLQDLEGAIDFDEGMPDVLKESLRLSQVLSLDPIAIELAKEAALQTDRSALSQYKYHRDIVVAERAKEESARDWNTLYTALTRMMQIQKETEPEHIMPITGTLLYSYDFGDGWEVDITLVKEFGKNNLIVDDEMAASVIATRKPICIAKDGLNVVDDCGHVSGYIEMLATIHEGEGEEAQWMKNWARSQGWTGRDMNPKHMI